VTATPALEVDDERYALLQYTIEATIEDLNDKIHEREEDYSDEDREAMEEKIREVRELRDALKIATGRAFDWWSHFEAVKTENGDNYIIPPGVEVDEHYVWTVLDDGEGNLCISPGFHYVNRLDYIMTTKPWTDADEEKEWIY
jgi:hypothetical protein